MDCFLCSALRENPKFREKREETKKISKEILLSCKQFLKARIHHKHKHKHKDVVLPDSCDDEIIGYHSSCYKEFRVKATYFSYESPTEKSSENCGWALIDDKYHYYGFDGPHSPSLGELPADVQESDDIYSDDCDEDEDDIQGETNEMSTSESDED